MISMTTCLFRSEGFVAVRRNGLLVVILTFLFGVLWGSADAETGAVAARTWKTVAELSPEERANIDFSATSPRHPEFAYLPAEPFPFAPPYTAE